MKNKKIQKIWYIIKNLIFFLWKKRLKKRGNIHLTIENASIKKIPFSSNKAWLRPTSSDAARVKEYFDSIYFTKSYLHQKLLDQKPSVLIDIGANIGLSTLSLLEEFKTIKKVIAIEGEKNNFDMLDSNFKLWTRNSKNVEFVALNKIIGADSADLAIDDLSLFELKKRGTASGTFRYKVLNNKKQTELGNNNFLKITSLNDLINDIPLDEKIIIKIDIEGGEEYLFEKNLDWIKRILHLTCEIHDQYHPTMINSSKNMIKAMIDHEFAVAVKSGTMYFYNKNN